MVKPTTNLAKMLSRIGRLETTRAETREALAVDPDRARECLDRALDRLSYLAGELVTHPDGSPGYRYWDFDPATFPAGCRPSAAACASHHLAEALGVSELARLGHHPSFGPPAGPRERSLMRRATRAANEDLRILAQLTAWFLSPSPET